MRHLYKKQQNHNAIMMYQTNRNNKISNNSKNWKVSTVEVTLSLRASELTTVVNNASKSIIL